MTDRMRHLPCGQAVNSNLGPTHFENLPAIRLRPEKHGCACGDEFLCYGNPAPPAEAALRGAGFRLYKNADRSPLPLVLQYPVR